MTFGDRRLRPRKTPKQLRSWETQQRILAAAARIFARHGYAAGTTNRIAAEAGLSIGSLYQYFPNKDAILVALVRQHVDDGTAHIQERLTGTDRLPLAERLDLLVGAMLANHAGDPRLHQVLFEEAPRPLELLAELHELERVVIDRVEQDLRADPMVQVDHISMAARLVVAAVESLVHRYIASEHDDLDIAAFRHELVTMLTRYLRG